MKDYKTSFEGLSNRLKGLSEDYKLSCFLSEMRGEFRLTVCMFNPMNLLPAYSLAKIAEENAKLAKKNVKRTQL